MISLENHALLSGNTDTVYRAISEDEIRYTFGQCHLYFCITAAEQFS